MGTLTEPRPPTNPGRFRTFNLGLDLGESPCAQRAAFSGGPSSPARTGVLLHADAAGSGRLRLGRRSSFNRFWLTFRRCVVGRWPGPLDGAVPHPERVLAEAIFREHAPGLVSRCRGHGLDRVPQRRFLTVACVIRCPILATASRMTLNGLPQWLRTLGYTLHSGP
jgi:hypothetical protein